MMTEDEFNDAVEGIEGQTRRVLVKAFGATIVCLLGVMALGSPIRLFLARQLGVFLSKAVVGTILFSSILPLLLVSRKLRRLTNNEPRLICPNCGERLQGNLAIATRRCACCSHQILVGPDETSGSVGASIVEAMPSKPGSELRTLDEFKAVAKKYQRLSQFVIGGAFLLFFVWSGTSMAIYCWLTPIGISTGHPDSQFLQSMVELAIFVPPFVFLFATIWAVERRARRDPLTRCPKCERQLPFLHQVIAIHHCGKCGGRVLPEIAEANTVAVSRSPTRLKNLADHYRRRIQRFTALLCISVIMALVLLTISGMRSPTGSIFWRILPNNILVLVAILFCVLSLSVLCHLERTVRREPDLRCPCCEKFLGYGSQNIGVIIASRNCLHCGRKIVADPTDVA